MLDKGIFPYLQLSKAGTVLQVPKVQTLKYETFFYRPKVNTISHQSRNIILQMA